MNIKPSNEGFWALSRYEIMKIILLVLIRFVFLILSSVPLLCASPVECWEHQYNVKTLQNLLAGTKILNKTQFHDCTHSIVLNINVQWIQPGLQRTEEKYQLSQAYRSNVFLLEALISYWKQTGLSLSVKVIAACAGMKWLYSVHIVYVFVKLLGNTCFDFSSFLCTAGKLWCSVCMWERAVSECMC